MMESDRDYETKEAKCGRKRRKLRRESIESQDFGV